jgi:hypothetical protein
MVAHIRITKVHNYMKDEIINISLFVSQGIKIINEIKYNKLWKMIYIKLPLMIIHNFNWNRGRLDRDRMVVGFATTYAISAYHHWCCEFESRSGRGVKHYMIKFVSDLRQVGGFLRVLRFHPPIKLTATI